MPQCIACSHLPHNVLHSPSTLCQAGKSILLHSFLPIERKQDDWCVHCHCFLPTLPPLHWQARVWGILFPAHYKGNDVINSIPIGYMGTSSFTLYVSHPTCFIQFNIWYGRDRPLDSHVYPVPTYPTCPSYLTLLCGIALIHHLPLARYVW